MPSVKNEKPWASPGPVEFMLSLRLPIFVIIFMIEKHILSKDLWLLTQNSSLLSSTGVQSSGLAEFSPKKRPKSLAVRQCSQSKSLKSSEVKVRKGIFHGHESPICGSYKSASSFSARRHRARIRPKTNEKRDRKHTIPFIQIFFLRQRATSHAFDVQGGKRSFVKRILGHCSRSQGCRAGQNFPRKACRNLIDVS